MIVVSVAVVTVTAVEPVMPSFAAPIVAVPMLTADTTPVALTVATPPSLELHVTLAVTSAVVPFEYVAVAVSACVVPLGSTGAAGVTSIATMTAGVTVSVVSPLTPFDEALTVVVPTASAVARPRDPAVILTVAVAPSDDAHVTESVMS